MSDKDPRMPQDNNSNDPKGNESPVNYKGLIFLGIAMFLIFIAINMKSTTQGEVTTWPDFVKKVKNGEIDSAKPLELIRKQESSEETLIAYKKTDAAEGTNKKIEVSVNVEFQKEELSELLSNNGLTYTPKFESNTMSAVLITLLPILLILLILYFFFRQQMKMAGRGAMSFGKSKAKMLNMDTKKVTFKDVAGVNEAKEEVSELVEYLKDPKKFQRLGGQIPKGVLMVGAPGTGKTLLARAIAGEADVPFFSRSGSDFVEMFVGVGASVRDMFEQGKNMHLVLFLLMR